MKCKATKPDIASMRLNLPTMIIYQEVSVIRLTTWYSSRLGNN